MSSSSLFRREVLIAQTEQHLGSIRIGRSPGFESVAMLALVLAAALVIFSVVGQVTRKAKISGVLMPVSGTIQISASAAGTLVETHVREGQTVAAGDTLFVLYTDRASSVGDTAARVGQSLQRGNAAIDAERALRELQSRQREQGINDRIRALETEHVRAESEAALAEQRVALAGKSVRRYEQLAREGFVADVQAQQHEEEWLDLRARADGAQRNVAALQRERQALATELAVTTTQSQTELAQLSRQQAALEQESTENQSRQRLVVVAHQSGVLTTIHVNTGTTVQAGQALAVLIPQQPDTEIRLEAQLFAPSRAAGFVEPGQTVWLRYAAFPYQKFGMAKGVVGDVSRTPFNAQDLPVGQANALIQAAQSNEPLYRVRVRLDSQAMSAYGQSQALKPGMALEADVIQDRRAVWEWVLEPILAARARVKVSQ